MSDFDKWIWQREIVERMRVQKLRALFDAGDYAGIAALFNESSDELDRAIDSGLVARCRGCSGRGTRETVKFDGSMVCVEAEFVIRRETIMCPDCGGLGLVRGCPCASSAEVSQ